jgi:DNA-binding NarL/FixJ family response regulator
MLSRPGDEPGHGVDGNELTVDRRVLNIVLVEPELGIERALTQHLQRHAGVVRHFRDGARALQAVPRLRADFVLIAQTLPDLSGEDCAQKLATLIPQAPRLVYSIHEDSEQLFKSTPGGVSGYVLKRTPPEHLLAPIEELIGAGRLTTARVSESVRRYFSSLAFQLESGQHDHAMSRLTRREKEILDCLSKGHLDKEIADALGISAWTVHGHIKNIFEKLQVHSRIEAVLKYLHK